MSNFLQNWPQIHTIKGPIGNSVFRTSNGTLVWNFCILYDFNMPLIQRFNLNWHVARISIQDKQAFTSFDSIVVIF
ncbi:MAG TPA: hypothetical protein DEP42_02915 [Ruminococcaceae bacterium]|nr:hypothetical protein [Oscillospiraceae bacterium]